MQGMDQSGNIADKLRGPRKTWRALIAVAAIVLVGVAGFSVSGALLKPEAARPMPTIVHLVGDQSKPTVPQVEHKLLLTTHVAKSTTPPPPPPAPENYYGNPGPIQCGYGYTAGAVDEYGNESNCYANGPGNAQCVAYDDANNCTQWYKP